MSPVDSDPNIVIILYYSYCCSAYGRYLKILRILGQWVVI